jgi:peptide/nickel transport system ATP-binding protein
MTQSVLNAKSRNRAEGTHDPILSIKDLRVLFKGQHGLASAVEGISFELYPGETLAIVGESGCGKSVTALSVLRLIPSPPGRIEGTAIQFGDRNLLQLSNAELQRIRGKEIAMIFQEPMTSLNPVLTIERQLTEAIVYHDGISREEAKDRAVESLRLVQIPEPARHIRQYPHQLSGGMRQRVMIAMAMSCGPKILIADEPTTALDVTIQAQILVLMKEIQKKLGTAIILITHDLGVVAETADRVVVMYAGRIVEEAPIEDLFEIPAHPYTQGLMNALPRLDRFLSGVAEDQRLMEMPGMVPSIFDRPKGCLFAPRCPHTTDRCRVEAPVMKKLRGKHCAACWEAGKRI